VKNWPGIRVIVLSPYLIFYRFERAATQVEILRFWHGARDPLSLELSP
jgi:plasmid stabilization system protein ParE